MLNSWASGQNAITQAVTLPQGQYRLLLNMKYECPNQQKNDGRKVSGSGCTNTSLTGVKIGTTTDYRYPSEPNSWETLCYDFTLDEAQSVTFSLGYQASASVGAANNTLLYIDHLRLLQKTDTRIANPTEAPAAGRQGIYDLQGRKVAPTLREGTPLASTLPKGIYIIDGRKVVR